MVLAPPKTPTSRRTLALSPRATAALHTQAATQATEQATIPGWANPLGLVFTNQTGEPLDPSNARRALARIGRTAGIPGLHPHALRHATASLLSGVGD